MPLRPSEIGMVCESTPWVQQAVREIDYQIAYTRIPHYDEEPLGPFLDLKVTAGRGDLTSQNRRDLANFYLMAGWKGVEFLVGDDNTLVRLYMKHLGWCKCHNPYVQQQPIVE